LNLVLPPSERSPAIES